MFSKKAAKIDEIFTVDLTVTTFCQIDGEDFVNFCGLLKKRELYLYCLLLFLLFCRRITIAKWKQSKRFQEPWRVTKEGKVKVMKYVSTADRNM